MNHNTSAQCHTENGEVFMTDQSGNGHHLKQNTMKKLSDTLTELGLAFTFPIKIKDENGNETYFENSSGYWDRLKYDEDGNETYYENSDGYWSRLEYDKNGNQTYSEYSNGYWYRLKYDENGNQTYYETSTGYKKGTKRSSCDGKVVEIDGKKYQLIEL